MRPHGAAVTPIDRAQSFLAAGLAALAFAGLLLRRKAGVCRLFPLYLACASAGHVFMATWPEMFFNWTFIALGSTLQAALRLGIVYEITWRTFKPLPRGFVRVGWLMVLVSLALVPVAASVPRDLGDAFDLWRAVERVSYGIAFLFLLYVASVRFYGIPVDPLHRALATGFGVVSVLVGCVSLLWRFDPWFGLGRDLIVKTAYPLLLTWWVVAAWRRDEFSGLSDESVRRLHPWRSQ